MIPLALALLLATLLQDDKDPNIGSLHAVWKGIIEQANTDKVDDIRKTISGWKIPKDEFTKLFGEGKSALAYEKYETFWKDVDQEAAADIVKRIKEKKYDTVDVWCVNRADPKTLSGNEKSVIESLANANTKVYSLRLRSKDDKDGFTLVCFFKIGDQWRAGFKVGRHLKAE